MLKKLAILTLACLLALSLPACRAEDAPDAAEALPAESGDAAAEAPPSPAPGYVLVSTATQSGWLPLPAEGEYSYHLRQLLPDGTEAENVIHLTPEGVYMEDSTCENHDCVGQGTVTLENRHERVLSNMIICLPNLVYLELYTPEEVVELMQAAQDTD